MASAAEHMVEAEKLLNADAGDAELTVAKAQVHATLCVAAQLYEGSLQVQRGY